MPQDLPWPQALQLNDVRISQIKNDLAENSHNIFSPPDGPIEIPVAEITPNGIEEVFLRTESSLREHLSIHHSQIVPCREDVEQKIDSDLCPRSSFFLVEPVYAWGNLPVTQDGILTLLAGLNVFPGIYRYLKAFGRKGFPMDESFAGFDSAISLRSSGQWASFESCYLLKYVERKTHSLPGSIPFQIRQALIYQKVNAEISRMSHILVRLPDSVTQKLSDSVRESGCESRFATDWTWLHTTCFRSVDVELRDMVNYLDKEVTEVFDRVTMSGVEVAKLNEFDSIQTSARDLKTLQFLADQAGRVISVIELNMMTMKNLQQKVDVLATTDNGAGAAPHHLLEFSGKLSECWEEYQFSLKNASGVLERAKTTLQHLRDTISLRNSEISKMNTETTSQNTLTIAKLVDSSGREANVVKTLTVLALVFVPASYVADFLQMGFVTIAQENPMTWKADPGLKIYAILAIPLVAVTMLAYGFVEMMQRSKENAKCHTSQV